MTLQDWRDADPADVAALYAAERRRWIARLSWDPEAAFAVLEQGRLAGGVAGWIARDERGRAAGWTYYVLHDGLLQLGGLVADRPAVTRALIDAVLASPEASLARGFMAFLFPDASGAGSALARQRFALRESVYLALDRPQTGPVPVSRTLVRAWREDDFAAAVRILETAYHGVPSAAAFAPDARREQWAHYTWQLLRAPGCGLFDPAASRVACAPDGRPIGVALATALGTGTAHLAQLAVVPEARSAGVGQALLTQVIASATLGGATRLTLLVDQDNLPARRLYDRLGFRERARMLFASRRARNRAAA